jgi:small-conductance mechanosensitive channel
LAVKDIVQKLLAGILLLIRHPFRAGDEITTGTGDRGARHLSAAMTGGA